MKTPLRYAIPLTLALSFPVGAALGLLMPRANATSCGPREAESWSLKLVDIEVTGDVDVDVQAIAWPADARISENENVEAFLHDEDWTFSITLAERDK